ncbi:MAG: hypothetical protein GX811_02285, partial [Lentisphaerae bacterium]|nr:hypothetical protein [Lentisphaerota bacterium]
MKKIGCCIREWKLGLALTIMLIGLVSAVQAADPVVSNVSATQRAGTKLVDITYDVTDPDSSSLSVSVQVSTNNGVTYDLPASSFSGSGYGNAVTPGTGKQIVWDAGADWDGQYSDKIWFKVTAVDTVTSDYLVIDVSGGSSASSYSVSTLNSVPVGGWTEEYKTDKIVLRRIPAGTFIMGSPTGELGRDAAETQHQVTLS